VRFRCGAALAKNDTTEADFVAGVPDSGIGHQYGYASTRYPEAAVCEIHTTGPQLHAQSQQMRDLVARMKLIPMNRSSREEGILSTIPSSAVRSEG